MLRIFLASTAILTTVGFAAVAQETTDPLVKEPEAQAPADMAPAAPDAATEAQSMEPAAPMGEAPATENAEDPSPMTPSATETADDPSAMPAAPATETAQEPASPGMMGDPVADAGPALTPVDVGTISADKLIGANIETRDSEDIATVEDVLMSPDGTSVESVVAQFGGFLGFGSNKVKLTLDEIEVLQDEAGTYVVQTDLTPEALEGRPEYQAEQ